MKVKNKKTITTKTTIEVSKEDIINALNASGDYNIPYNAHIWVDCEKRTTYDMEMGCVNISFDIKEEVPEEKEQSIPF